MPASELKGHDSLAERFRRSVARGRLGQAYLFVGPQGIGKLQFALRLAQALLCATSPNERLEPCGTCTDCRLVEAGNHPDLVLVARPEDKHELPVELFIGPRERRGQEGMCHELSLRPARGRRKIAVVDDADDLNAESANCLLKTLEEPPPHALLILVGTSPERQLPTIRSRCQIVRFSPLSTEAVAEILQAQGLVADCAEAAQLAALSGGSIGRAIELADPELRTFRHKLFEGLSDPTFDSVELAREVNEFVEAAGSEGAARRARAGQLVGFCTEFYHGVLRLLCDAEPQQVGDEDLVACQRLRDRLAPGGATVETIDAVSAMVDRTLEAAYHIDRRVHLALALECLFDDLSRATEPALR